MDVPVRGVPNLKAQRKNERKKSGKEPVKKIRKRQRHRVSDAGEGGFSGRM